MPHVIAQMNSQALTIQMFPLTPDAIRVLRAEPLDTHTAKAPVSEDK